MTDDLVLGVDVGGGTVKTVVMAGPEVVVRDRAERSEPLPELLERLVTSAISDHAVAAVGVGIAGLVDHPDGRFVWGPHLSDERVDVDAILGSLIASHYIDNDANCAAHAEWAAGPATGHRVALTVSVGTGIGAGLVVDGAIWRGGGFAGEVGHMRITDAAHICPCGRAGCWETVVSGRRLGLDAAELGFEPTAEALTDAALGGSQAARDALTVAGRWLGEGLADLMLVLDPSIVVIAGGVSGAGDLILGAARERIASVLPGHGHRPVVDVVRAEHGRWSAATGAAMLAAAGTPGRPRRSEGDETE